MVAVGDSYTESHYNTLERHLLLVSSNTTSPPRLVLSFCWSGSWRSGLTPPL